MKNIIPLVCFSFALCIGSQVLVSPVSASPIVQEKDDLEKMILKKIEERRKEMEAEKAKNGSSSSNPKSNSSSRSNRPVARSNTRTATPSNRTTGSPARNTNTPGRSTTVNAKPASNTSNVKAPSRVRPTSKDPQFTQPTVMNIPSPDAMDPNVKLTFSFQDEEWKDIIEWFADEIGFGLIYPQTGAPTGTHTYRDPNEYTLIEALDKLNSWLALMEPSHVLVRNDNLLILVNESDRYPEPILPFVTPDALKNFSEYEVVRCKFDLGDLNGNVLATQLRENVAQVHLDGFAYIEASNQLIVRERVRVLREIASIINDAGGGGGETFQTYEFQHADPETALVTIRHFMGIPEGANHIEDGSLRFSLSIGSDKVHLYGTPEKIRKFQEIAAIVDVPVEGGVESEVPYFQKHSISGDTEVIFQIVQTMLDGELNVRMDQDSVTGAIYILGPKRVHDEVTALLQTMISSDDNFDIVPLKNIRPSDAVDTIEELLNIDTFAEDTSGQPRLMADSERDAVLVYGTAQQRKEIRSMLEQLDQTHDSENKTRKRMRVIRMPPRDVDNVLNYLEIPGIMDSIGRKNRLRIILPEDRKNYLNRNRRSQEPTNQGTGAEGSDREGSNQEGSRRGSRVIRRTTQVVTKPKVFYASTFLPQEDENTLGTVTGGNQDGSGEVADQEINIPGSDISIQPFDQGIIITTDDLDAGDDIEELIDEIIGVDGTPEFPTFIGIQYRDANEVKALLDHILGLSSGSSGGGGGGLMNLVGGAMSNAVGGAAGDALGGLLGGGDSAFSDSTAGAVELEGEDVSITVDGRSNTLIVIGATSNDIDFIIELVDVVDIDSPAHRPNLQGKTYIIPVKYRDPMDIKEILETQYADLFRSSQANANNQNRQNPEQAIQRAVLQQLQGNRRGGRGGNAAGGGANNASSEAPKATLGIDEESSSLLVTGPEAIYEVISDLVAELDVESLMKRSRVPMQEYSAASVARLLKDAFGDQVEIIETDGEEESATGTPSSGSSSSNRGGNRSSSRGSSRSSGGSRGAPSAQDIQRSIQDAFRSRGGGARPNLQPRR